MMAPVGFCFISREDFPEYCRICTDTPPDASYETYMKNMQEFCDSFAAKGGRAVKIPTKPADLLAWCKARGLDVNSSSRSHYAAVRLIELDKK